MNANVVVYNNGGEKVDKMLKRFKKAMKDSNILSEYQERQSYVAPSEKRRLKSKAARRRKSN